MAVYMKPLLCMKLGITTRNVANSTGSNLVVEMLTLIFSIRIVLCPPVAVAATNFNDDLTDFADKSKDCTVLYSFCLS